MTIKQFKNKFKKHCNNIEKELEYIIALTEDIDDLAISDIIQEVVSNVYITLIDQTNDLPTDKRVIAYHEYLEELEMIENDDNEEENSNDEY